MSIELINADFLRAQLLQIPQKIRVAVETKAVREASQLIVGRFRENAPSETGALRRSLKFDVRKYRGGNIVVGIVGADYDYVGTVSRNKQGRLRFERTK
ncbi:MAG: HK97 gp10 family phage protein [Planctomycetaceae bacterium]|nr:HK97 gp10 family phage protein [Planctomycetaceae bacterium]